MADIGDTAKNLFKSILSPKGKTPTATDAAATAAEVAAAAQLAAPVTLTYDEPVAQYNILEKQNAKFDAEITRLGNLKPPPATVPTGTTAGGNRKPPPATVPTGTIANLPPTLPAGGKPAPNVQVQTGTGANITGAPPAPTPPLASTTTGTIANLPPAPAGRANVVAQQAQGGAMPPMPRMGNIILNDRTNEAWTGGAPKLNWTELVYPNQIPLPTQIRSTSSKAAMSLVKRTEGLFREEANKFKHKGNINYLCTLLRDHFVMHGIDTILYREDSATNTMVSILDNYPRFSREEIVVQDEALKTLYDSYDNRNDQAATKCLLNSLCDDLKQDLLSKIDDGMKFTEIFMIFQDNERPESVDLYDSLERKVLELDFRKYPGANIKAMAIDARKCCTDLYSVRTSYRIPY